MALLNKLNTHTERVLGDLGLEPLEATEEELRARHSIAQCPFEGIAARSTRAARYRQHLCGRKLVQRAKIHPRKARLKLTQDELRRLQRAVRDILLEAIRLRRDRRFRTTSIPAGKWGNINCGIAESQLSAGGKEMLPLWRADSPHHRGRAQQCHFYPRCQPPPRAQARTNPPRAAKATSARLRPVYRQIKIAPSKVKHPA